MILALSHFGVGPKYGKLPKRAPALKITSKGIELLSQNYEYYIYHPELISPCPYPRSQFSNLFDRIWYLYLPTGGLLYLILVFVYFPWKFALVLRSRDLRD